MYKKIEDWCDNRDNILWSCQHFWGLRSMHETSQIITAIRKLSLHLSAFYSTFPVRNLKSIVNIEIQKENKLIDVASWITLTKLNEGHNVYSRMYSHIVSST